MHEFPIFRFKIFENFSDRIRHGISIRDGGVGLALEDEKNNITENYKRFCERIGIDIEKLCLAYQKHTDNILVIRENEKTGLNHPFDGTDGFITNIAGLPLMVRFADCQGIFIFDPVCKVVAAVHCGWRGNTKNIIGKAVKKMINEFNCDAENLLVGISPSLGPCCAEFTDPYKELPEFMHKYIKDNRVDLWQCSFDQLIESGVSERNIEIAKRCTVCENDKFFSYRGDEIKTGRMGGAIMIDKT